MSKPEHTLTVAELIIDRMAKLGKTPNDIAAEMAAPNPNVISMIAKGALKLPFNFVSPLARALNINVTHLLRLTLREYSPDLLDAVENVLQRPLISSREVALIEGFRAITGDRDVSSVVVERDGLLEVIVLEVS
jgi:hypothetical protein